MDVSPADHRRVGVGRSDLTDPAHAAIEAVQTAVAGFHTYGEIARTQGVSGFHDQTLVVLAVG